MKVGDVVVLKSGGPEMTILRIHSGSAESVAECGWFDKTPENFWRLESDNFPMESLVKMR